jgi:hypothetical protein
VAQSGRNLRSLPRSESALAWCSQAESLVHKPEPDVVQSSQTAWCPSPCPTRSRFKLCHGCSRSESGTGLPPIPKRLLGCCHVPVMLANQPAVPVLSVEPGAPSRGVLWFRTQAAVGAGSSSSSRTADTVADVHLPQRASAHSVEGLATARTGESLVDSRPCRCDPAGNDRLGSESAVSEAPQGRVRCGGRAQLI